MQTAGDLAPSAIFRLLSDIIVEEICRDRNTTTSSLRPDLWTFHTHVGDDGLALDSLELLNCAGALNEFFHLHEYGAEDYLLHCGTLGEWVEIIAQSLKACGTHLTFRTSGSTGEAKRCTHRFADLMSEVDIWCTLLMDASCFVSAVPAHHIYGTIFSILVPQRLGVACTDARFINPAHLQQLLVPHAVMVSVPTLWQYFSRSLLHFPPQVTGISSTSALPSHLAGQLAGQRLSRMIEIYGSTETGGVGWRAHSLAPFQLLDHWTLCAHDKLSRRDRLTSETVMHPVMDIVEWLDEKSFMVVGRRDGAVQIGGHNVFPERVREHLLQHAGVEDCAVRFSIQTGRLQVFVVPSSVAATTPDLQAELIRWCDAGLRTVERPKRYSFGAAIPITETGKLASW